jgi:large subunit ribosomal protein L1
MPKAGKKYREVAAKVDRQKSYEPTEAVRLLKEIKFAKFDESVDASFVLGVDPKHADQMVRGTVVLPRGTGKSKRVAVIATGEKMKEAEDAGADIVGGKDLVERIQGGWMDFDALVVTPDTMKDVGRLGRILGPRGLMPNPKAGTVTMDVGRAVKEIKAGKVEFRVDKNGVIHAPMGRASFSADQLQENLLALALAVIRAKPASAKGTYLRAAYISTTMSPSVKLDVSALEKAADAA